MLSTQVVRLYTFGQTPQSPDRAASRVLSRLRSHRTTLPSNLSQDATRAPVQVLCKRKNPRERRNSRRREMREIEKELKQKELQTKERPLPTLPPPSTLEDAVQRVQEAQLRLAEAATDVRSKKQAAIDDGLFSNESGFKRVPGVQKALKYLHNVRGQLLEAQLEQAALLLSIDQGGPPRTLTNFGFWSGEGLTDRNVASCGFLLAAAVKRRSMGACQVALDALPPPHAPCWQQIDRKLLDQVTGALLEAAGGSDGTAEDRAAWESAAVRAQEAIGMVISETSGG